MARDCTICSHPHRRDIDRALIEGQSCRAVAAAHGVDFRAVDRHRRNHLPIAIRAAARAALDSAAGVEAPPNTSTPAAPICEAVDTIADNAPAAPGTSPAPIRSRQRTRGIQLTDTPPAPLAEQSASAPAGSAAPVAGTFNLYASATDLRERALAILAAAERDGDAKTALMAIREARGVLDHLSRLEERQGGNAAAIPLVDSPEWHRTRAAIISALADHPEARIAVAEALIATGALQ
jgi:hypothetical protein